MPSLGLPASRPRLPTVDDWLRTVLAPAPVDTGAVPTSEICQAKTGVPDQRQDIQWIIDKTVLKLLVRISKQNSPRAVCALPEQTFCSVHQSASSCLHWHSKCLASDEPPDFRASTSACKRLASDRAASSSLANIICQSANLRISLRHLS